MKLFQFLRDKDQLTVKLGLFKFGFVCLIGLAFYQSQQVSSCIANQKVILLPPGSTEEMVIYSSQANETYLRMMVPYLTQLMLTYTPHNIEGQLETLLKLYPAKYYATLRPRFEDMAGKIILGNLTQVFYPAGVLNYDLENKTIKIEGNIHQTINNEQQKPTKASYTVKYEIRDGKFFLMELSENESKS